MTNNFEYRYTFHTFLLIVAMDHAGTTVGKRSIHCFDTAILCLAHTQHTNSESKNSRNSTQIVRLAELEPRHESQERLVGCAEVERRAAPGEHRAAGRVVADRPDHRHHIHPGLFAGIVQQHRKWLD